ncbi:MAG: ABC transporter permease [Planctomycetes bacterium]|nr:ABC transporter permease [Planctomycetota bacterium]
MQVDAFSPFIAAGTFCIGVVFAIATAHEFSKFNVELRTVSVLTVATLHTLAPIFTALLLAGRIASGLAAELGAMQQTQQIDAMRSLSMDVQRHLIAPRVLAAAVGGCLLTAMADVLTLAGGFVVVTSQFDIQPATYVHRVLQEADTAYFLGGLLKGLVFGLIIGTVGCLRGTRIKRGTAEVGEDTKHAVVSACFLILLTNVLLTQWLVVFFP